MQKILVVEDDVRFLRNYRRGCHQQLEQGLFEFEFVNTGEKGLQRLQDDINKEIALIILDLKMEFAQIDGLQFLEKISKSHIKLPIICYTAYPEKIENLDPRILRNVVCVLSKGENEDQFKVLRGLMESLLSETVAQQLLAQLEKNILDYNKILATAKSFSDRKKLQLIQELVSTLSYPYLKEFYREVPPIAKAIVDSVDEKNQRLLRQWVLEKVDKKLLTQIPTDDSIIYRIEESIRGSRETSRYYYLKWFDKNLKKDNTKYIPRDIADTLPPEFRSS